MSGSRLSLPALADVPAAHRHVRYCGSMMRKRDDGLFSGLTWTLGVLMPDCQWHANASHAVRVTVTS